LGRTEQRLSASIVVFELPDSSRLNYQLWSRLSGSALAQANLGWMYQAGNGVPQNYPEALKWFRKAADEGDAMAQAALGLMYHNGQGVPQDHAEALKWYHLAADQGFALAQNTLSVMYAKQTAKACLGIMPKR
jgi:TPR repeat protein